MIDEAFFRGRNESRIEKRVAILTKVTKKQTTFGGHFSLFTVQNWNRIEEDRIIERAAENGSATVLVAS